MVDIEDVIAPLLARARAHHPGVDWVVTVAHEQAPRVNRSGTELWRTRSGKSGFYPNVDVYADAEVRSMDLSPWLVIVGPVVEPEVPSSSDAPTYYCDLRTGAITQNEFPADGVPAREDK